MRTKKIIVLLIWANAISFALWGLFNASHPNCFVSFLVAAVLYAIGNELRIKIIKENAKRTRK